MRSNLKIKYDVSIHEFQCISTNNRKGTPYKNNYCNQRLKYI